MRFLTNMKKLLGVGPSIIVVFAAIEGVAVFVNQWVGFPISLAYKTQIILTIIFVLFLLSGMAWFNFTLNLIEVNFRNGDRNLVISGPFNYVRHPLYSSIALTVPAIVIIWESDLLYFIPWILILFITHFIVMIEERELIDQFGDQYNRYKKYVPALLPYKGANGKRHYEEIMKV